jgi:AcrR family transcriptional regulator
MRKCILRLRCGGVNKIHLCILWEMPRAMRKAVRRRGRTLDDAILGAAWAELLDRGYADFTMDGVAKRAGTSRPVLSRRWQTRADLAVAAIGSYLQGNRISVPDLGSVRDELAMLLQKASEKGMRTVIRVLFSMRDYFVETDSSLDDLRNKLIGGSRPLDEVLQRGVRRGEIDPSKLTQRIASLPLDLLRHEVFMTHKPVTKAVIAEMLDSIFLPLVATKKTTVVAKRP